MDLATEITCVVPTHERPAQLRRALESILDQTRRPREVVVANDASPLELPPDLERAAAGLGITLSVVHLDPDGPGSAGRSRNAGARAATGGLIAFLDDDDEWKPDFLASMTTELERTGARLAVCWGDLARGTEVWEENWRIGRTARFPDALTPNPGFTGSNAVVGRELWAEVQGFDEALWSYNDIDFYARVLRARPEYAVVERALVIQHIDAGGTHLSSRGERRAEAIARYIAKHQDHLTRPQLRKLRRDFHVAKLHPQQTLVSRVGHTAAAVTLSSSSETRATVARLVGARGGYN